MTTLQEKIAVMQHFADGGEVEFNDKPDENCDELGWEKIGQPSWDWHEFNYRIAITKPSINWEHVSEKYNYLAVDGDGRVYLYSEKPSVRNVSWIAPESNSYITARGHASFKPGTCDWKDSLISRFDG